MRFIFFKKGNPTFSIKLGQKLPKSFSQLHVKNSRFFLSYFLKKDDWPKAYAGRRLPTLLYYFLYYIYYILFYTIFYIIFYISIFTIFYISLREKIFLWLYQPEKYYSRFNYIIIIIPTIKYGSPYYNTFTMAVSSYYHGNFFLCDIEITMNIYSSPLILFITTRYLFQKRFGTRTMTVSDIHER